MVAGIGGLGLVQAADMAGPPNSLVVDDSGDVGVGTATPGASLEVTRSDDTAKLLVEETGSGGNQALLHLKKTAAAPFQRYESAFGFWDFSAGNFFVINDPADATIEFLIDKAGNLTVSGSVTPSSSRTVKQDFEAIDPRGVLAKVMALPITQWSYKQDQQVRHLGPVAEDFAAAFGLGASDKTISVLDSSGVALAAIQGLKAQKDAEIAALKKEKDQQIQLLTQRLEQLERLVLLQKVAVSNTDFNTH
jgi:Zn-dependent alcohol dehydrogenase